MITTPVVQPDPPPFVACTISRDVQLFDLLIEDMELALGDAWGDLTFDEALTFLSQPEAVGLQFVTIAMNAQDEDHLDQIAGIIAAAKAARIKVILITDDLSPSSLHKLLRAGGDEFVPYPLPESELARAIERVLTQDTISKTAPGTPAAKATGDKSGVVIPVHGLAGGTGATIMAVNLAWELAIIDKKDPPKVCLIDLDFQFGTAATYLDLPRRESVLELLSDTAAMDADSFMQALLVYGDRLSVLTAPTDMIPLDMLSPTDISRLIEIARVNFDYVVIDMPSSMVEWSQTVLEAAHVYFAMIELEMRSAQNTLRLKRALQSEDLPFSKIRFILNRAPGFTDLNGKSRVKRLAESLGIAIDVLMPDGGKAVVQSADHGSPLAEHNAKNALRREIQKLARSVHDVNINAVADIGG